jgi:glycosyltransferase involved in cell wall biosynthesis
VKEPTAAAATHNSKLQVQPWPQQPKPPAKRFHWLVVAPFIATKNTGWLTSFIDRESVHFSYVPANYSHVRWRTKTSRSQWIDYFKQSVKAVRMSPGRHARKGYITVFPQLAFGLAAIKLITGSKKPIIAWCFNVGSIPVGLKRWVASRVLSKVDVFVVHSVSEIEAISQGFSVPKSKIVFAPLQRALMPLTVPTDVELPFIVALGTAQRDYKTLFDAVRDVDIPVTVVASRSSLDGLTVPENVTVLEKLSADQCHVLIQRSTFVVTPLKASPTAAGQVTLLDAMMYAKASVSSNVAGTIDYALNGETTMLVLPADVDAMRNAILKLWSDVGYRQTMERRAFRFVSEELSDEKLAVRLNDLLRSFEEPLMPESGK